MRLRTFLILSGLALANVAHASPLTIPEQRNSIPPVLFDNRCQTDACRVVGRDIQAGKYEPIRLGDPSRAAINTCVDDNQSVGRFIGRADFYVTQHEYANGGRLSFDDASETRALFYSETYMIREALRAYATAGDVAQCHRLRDLAIAMVQNVLNDHPVGSKR